LRRRRERRPRGVVDTSVLVAGIAGLKRGDVEPKNDSARLLRDWVQRHTFTWLVSDEILMEYREVLARLRVRRALIGRVVNLLSEEAELVRPGMSTKASPDPDDEPFCTCAESGNASFIITLNLKDFPQSRLRAKVLLPGEIFTGGGVARATPRSRRTRSR
jgi:predicted nucleic acid-binding protein